MQIRRGVLEDWYLTTSLPNSVSFVVGLVLLYEEGSSVCGDVAVCLSCDVMVFVMVELLGWFERSGR